MVDPPESVVEAGFGSASGGIIVQSATSDRNEKSSTATHPLLMSPLMAVSMIYRIVRIKCQYAEAKNSREQHQSPI